MPPPFISVICSEAEKQKKKKIDNAWCQVSPCVTVLKSDNVRDSREGLFFPDETEGGLLTSLTSGLGSGQMSQISICVSNHKSGEIVTFIWTWSKKMGDNS